MAAPHSRPLALALVLVVGCAQDSASGGDCQPGSGGKGDSQSDGRFPDYATGQLPDDWETYSRYRFQLAQDYPGALPDASETPTFMSLDFRAAPDDYLFAVRGYVFDGFIHPGEQTNGHPDMDFRAEFNTVRKWYGVPWMHTGAHPREGLHGLTRELDAQPGKLDPAQIDTLQDWGVAFYNALGGYTIGQVWKDHLRPDVSAASFPEGATVFKILFTEGDATEVPWTDGAPTFWANIDADLDAKGAKLVHEVRLIQMDVAIKDARAATGWVYGTFVYDPAAEVSDDDLTRYGAYARMMPVGLSFGNDPGKLPGTPLEETLLSARIPPHAQKTLGWGGRMNGPADNPSSACQSCHATAEWPARSPMAPRPSTSNDARLRWFRDLASGQPFDDSSLSLGTSLQLEIAMRNFTAQHR